MPNRISAQTRDPSFFTYNALTGAEIHLFPRDRTTPRVFILHTHPHRPMHATACGGRVEIHDHGGAQYSVYVNGKPTKRFSITFPGRKQKQRFARN